MSLVRSTYSEATQTARCPSRQFDMQKAPSSHGKTKRKPTGDSIPVERGNEVHPSPSKRACTSPSDPQQARHVLAPTGTIENREAHAFVDVIHQKRTNKPVRTQSLSNIKTISQVHAISTGASPSLPGAVPGEPNAGGNLQIHAHVLSPERLKIVKGKQPDRRHNHKHKHEAHPSHDPAQQFLAFLMHNWQMQMALHNSSVEASAIATAAPTVQALSGEPASEPGCTRSRFGPVTRYSGVTYASPFEGMLVKRSPWPAAAAVMQEVVECGCSICARALARRLESAPPPPATPLALSLPPPEPEAEQPPALEPTSIQMVGVRAAAPPNLNLNSNSNELRVEPVPTAQPPMSPSHQFFPHIKKALSNVSHTQAEAGPSKPSPACLSPTSAQDLIAMLFAASMSDLGSTIG